MQNIANLNSRREDLRRALAAARRECEAQGPHGHLLCRARERTESLVDELVAIESELRRKAEQASENPSS